MKHVCIYVSTLEYKHLRTCITFLLDHKIQLATAKSYLLELERNLQEDQQLIALTISHINAHLHNALLACAAVKHYFKVPAFSGKKFIAPGKDVKRQWRFTKGNQTPGRKKRTNILQ